MKKIPTKFYEYTAKILLIIIIPLLIIFNFWLDTNTNPLRAKKILNENNYIFIKYTGYKWFACSYEDWSHTGFIATNSVNYKQIKGVVCCGLIFKNCTIRFD